MTYNLRFTEAALKEWRKLDAGTRDQFKKKLAEVLEQPHVKSAQLSTMPGCYKIKLRAVGYRLVYKVVDSELVVSVIAVGKRNRNEVYEAAMRRLR